MPERAHPDEPQWRRRFGVLPTPGLRYVQWRYSFARHFVAGKSVLDVPCGAGIGLPYLRRASHLVGVDRDAGALEFAAERFGWTGVRLLRGDMTDIPLAAESFDVVTCMEGIEHVARPDGIRFMGEVARVLRPGGYLLVSCPVSVDGRHSGNEYHLYEWTVAELVGCLETRFVLREKLIRGSPDSPVVLLALELRPDGKAPPAEVQVLEDARQRTAATYSGAQRWIAGMWSGSQASYARDEPPSFLATCFAVLAEETLGSLAAWSPERRTQVALELGAAQDQLTGLFGAQLSGRGTLAFPGLCDCRYLELQMTYFGLSALTALGERAPHPLSFAHAFLDPSYSVGWIEGAPQGDIWNLSNRVMFLLRFLIEASHGETDRHAAAAIDRVIDWLIDTQDPETGLWHSYGPRDIREAVYATYHFLPFLFWRGVRPPRAERSIDSVLSIQAPDGLFGSSLGGGACEDLDAIDMLVDLSLVTDHRLRDVEHALTRARDRVLQLQKDDGGFPNHHRAQPFKPVKSVKRQIGEAVKLDVLLNKPYRPEIPRDDYSGWSEVGAAVGAADMWGTWFRSLALVLISSRFPHLGSIPEGTRFHAFPCLGWHDPAAIMSSSAHPRYRPT
ncbi:MAG: methyltransferase domain-containing protein [Armatimonadetes bacterium]|nr:methyltransferase domain-containing protein [Armatimonadota bacterium]